MISLAGSFLLGDLPAVVGFTVSATQYLTSWSTMSWSKDPSFVVVLTVYLLAKNLNLLSWLWVLSVFQKCILALHVKHLGGINMLHSIYLIEPTKIYVSQTPKTRYEWKRILEIFRDKSIISWSNDPSFASVLTVYLHQKSMYIDIIVYHAGRIYPVRCLNCLLASNRCDMRVPIRSLNPQALPYW